MGKLEAPSGRSVLIALRSTAGRNVYRNCCEVRRTMLVMTDTEALVSDLLYEEEGTALDFKSQQYPFAGATDEQKGELIKDILAFANSWKRSDAYIVIGVREIGGAKCEVLGVSGHLEDAAVQQLVNSKTQRPLSFSYRAVRCEGKDVGLIHVPVQDRPVFLTKDFGRLLKNVVYVRRGSSTAEALPDEVACMGREQVLGMKVTPELTLGVASSRFEPPEGRSVRIRVRRLRVPAAKSIPDYRESGLPVHPFEHSNRSYYRELVHYVRVSEETAGFHFVVSNRGPAVANDVRIECEAQRSTGIVLRDSRALPEYPERVSSSMVLPGIPGIEDFSRDLSVERRGDRLWVRGKLGKIQPGAEGWTDNRLYVGSRESGSYNFVARIFCDELPQPNKVTLEFEIDVTEEEASLARIEELDHERAFASDSMREYQDSIEDAE